jgi:adenylate cyclase
MSPESFKRKLTAILSADVKGYSRLMGENEVGTIRILQTYRGVISDLIQKKGGRVVDSPGDNMLAEFASVVDALESAVQIQRELKVRNADRSESRRMEFRMGINLGDVVEEGERIYGDGVNIAARIEGLAEGGGICISGTAFDQIGKRLPLGYEYMGEQEVKNIEKPVRVYRVLMEPEQAGKVIGEKGPKRIQSRWAAVTVALLVLVAGGLVWNFYWRAPKIEPASKEKMAFPLPDKPSIAVLAFDNMSANPEYDSLADSLSENIIYTLSYLPGMFVVARNSTFTYKGKPVEIRQVAEQLGVRYVLEGSVLRAEDRVRVTAQLIDATTGYHLWSGRFDRTVKDIFSLLDEITKTIAGELQVKVSPDQWASLAHKTDNFDAWAATTKAYSLLTRGFRENAVEIKRLAEKGVLLDPKYGFGWAVLAAVHTLEVIYGLTQSPSDSIKLAAECNEKSLTLDPTLSCATANRGQIYLLQGKVEEATAFCRKAIDMAPSLDMNYIIFGITMDFAGNFDEAIPLFKKAMRLNPFYPAGYLKYYGMSCFMADRKEAALTAFKDCFERAQRGEYPLLSAHLMLCAVYAELGKEEEARSHIVEILRITPTFSIEEARKLYRWKDPRYSERWLSSLRKAGLPEKPPLPLPDKPSIAVLPFVNMSDDKSQEYFSDGLTEEIITALSKTPKLFVIASNSSFVYKGKPVNVQQVSRELGVKYVLEGSVRRSGDQLRITVQLIDALTGNHLWAERYDRELKDLFSLQDEITMKVITALEVKLTEGEQALVTGSGTHNLDAYLKTLQARELKRNQTIENNYKARQLAEEAIRLDPSYAQAYRWLSGTYVIDVWLGSTKSPQESLNTAQELVKKALSLDDSMGGAHGLLGNIYVMKKEYEKGVREAERAAELEPNGADAHAFLGMALHFADRAEEAIPTLKKAIRLDPYSPGWYLHVLAGAYRDTEKYKEAIEWGEKAVQQNPQNVLSHVILCSIYRLAGQVDKARSQADEVMKLNPKFSVTRFAMTDPQKNQVLKKRYIDALQEAGLPD